MPQNCPSFATLKLTLIATVIPYFLMNRFLVYLQQVLSLSPVGANGAGKVLFLCVAALFVDFHVCFVVALVHAITAMVHEHIAMYTAGVVAQVISPICLVRTQLAVD